MKSTSNSNSVSPKRKTVSFIVRFSYYSGAILLISLAIQLWIPEVKISSSWPLILVFMYVFTVFAFYMLARYINDKLTYFANAFMLVNFGKLVLFSIIIVVYAWFNRDDAISFTATFFVYYLLLTTFEIIALLKSKQTS